MPKLKKPLKKLGNKKIKFQSTDKFDNIINSGFLVPIVKVAQETGIFDLLSQVKVKMRNSPVYTQLNKFQTLIASICVGCEHIKDINSKLVPDVQAASLFNMERFPDQSQINIFLRRSEKKHVKQIQKIQKTLLKKYSNCHNEKAVTVDVDTTFALVVGKTYELVKKCYKNKKGFKISQSFVGNNIDETFSLYLDPANIHCKTHFRDLVNDAFACIPKGVIITFRGDSAFGSIEDIIWLLNHKRECYYAIAGYCPKTAKVLYKKYKEQLQWLPSANNPQKEVAELGWIFVSGHNRKEERPVCYTRVVLVRIWNDKKQQYEYRHLLTNISESKMNAVELEQYYQGRQTIEAFFKEEKNALAMKNLRTRDFWGNYVFFLLVAITNNLISWVKHSYFKGTKLFKAGLREIIKKVMTIPAFIKQTKDEIILLFPHRNKLAQIFIEQFENTEVLNL